MCTQWYCICICILGWGYSSTRYDKDEGFPEDVEFVPYERNEHVSRRRRLVRTRKRVDGPVQEHKASFALIIILCLFKPVSI